jgi:hypothetical protein
VRGLAVAGAVSTPDRSRLTAIPVAIDATTGRRHTVNVTEQTPLPHTSVPRTQLRRHPREVTHAGCHLFAAFRVP